MDLVQNLLISIVMNFVLKLFQMENDLFKPSIIICHKKINQKLQKLQKVSNLHKSHFNLIYLYFPLFFKHFNRSLRLTKTVTFNTAVSIQQVLGVKKRRSVWFPKRPFNTINLKN